jgi:hypothetical protein
MRFKLTKNQLGKKSQFKAIFPASSQFNKFRISEVTYLYDKISIFDAKEGYSIS